LQIGFPSGRKKITVREKQLEMPEKPLPAAEIQQQSVASS
jgi:hypothetical protein